MNPDEMKFVKQGLNKFAKAVVLQSKGNLKGGSALAKSIKEKIKVSKNSIEIDFLMKEYGLYQDKGVKGAINPYKGKDGAKPYEKGKKYRFGTKTGKKGGLTKGILKWVKARRFQFREKKQNGKKGTFMSYENTAFLITRSIWSKGIKPSLFFTKPFEKEFKKLPKQIAEDFALDVKALFKFSTKKISK